MENIRKIASRNYSGIFLRVIPGHFATSNSHVNYYIDMTLMKARQSEASAVAKALSGQYRYSTIVDTIVCMDGCDVIGAYLANELTSSGIVSMNAHQTIYITAPELPNSDQLIFRENLTPMIKGKHVLLLLTSATTGKTISGAIDAIRYYGGNVVGVSAIFSAVDKVYELPVNALFTKEDLPDYETFSSCDCSMCKEGQKIEAIINGFGYARIE